MKLLSCILNLLGQGQDKPMTEERAKGIIRDYIEVSAQHADRSMVDQRELPHAKEAIKKALLFFMGEHPRLKDSTAPLLIRLAIYQKGIAGRDAIEILDAVEAEMKQLQADMSV